MSFSHSVMDTHNFLHDLGSPNCHTLIEVAHSHWSSDHVPPSLALRKTLSPESSRQRAVPAIRMVTSEPATHCTISTETIAWVTRSRLTTREA